MKGEDSRAEGTKVLLLLEKTQGNPRGTEGPQTIRRKGDEKCTHDFDPHWEDRVGLEIVGGIAVSRTTYAENQEEWGMLTATSGNILRKIATVWGGPGRYETEEEKKNVAAGHV